MDNVMVNWQTWYNFRSKRQINGSYALYLDGQEIDSGMHVFDKFWRPTNLLFSFGQFEAGKYNLTFTIFDEGKHITTDTINILIDTYSKTSVSMTNSTKRALLSSITFIMGIIALLTWYIGKKSKK